MKPIDLTYQGSIRCQFTLDADGYFRLDVPEANPHEGGFTGYLTTLQARLELATFLEDVAQRLGRGAVRGHRPQDTLTVAELDATIRLVEVAASHRRDVYGVGEANPFRTMGSALGKLREQRRSLKGGGR